MSRTTRYLVPALALLLLLALPGEGAREVAALDGTHWYILGKMSCRVEKLGRDKGPAGSYARFGPAAGLEADEVGLSMLSRSLGFSLSGTWSATKKGRANLQLDGSDAEAPLFEKLETAARDYMASYGSPGASSEVRVTGIECSVRAKGTGRLATIALRSRITFEVEARGDGVTLIFRGKVKFDGRGASW